VILKDVTPETPPIIDTCSQPSRHKTKKENNMSKILHKLKVNVFDNIAEKSKTPYYKTKADCYNAILMIMVEEELEKTRIALNKELIRLSKHDCLKIKEKPIQIESIQTTANIAIEVSNELTTKDVLGL
tara:strand:- start:111 stop:497 length:387 start_codon:yes stop_codon:yes gene_type:complete